MPYGAPATGTGQGLYGTAPAPSKGAGSLSGEDEDFSGVAKNLLLALTAFVPLVGTIIGIVAMLNKQSSRKRGFGRNLLAVSICQYIIFSLCCCIILVVFSETGYI